MATSNGSQIIQGVPGSPYTRKMLAVLRYKHIPYRYITPHQAQQAGLPRPPVGLLPTLYFAQPDGTLQAAVDSTLLIRRLETLHPSRAVLPPDPAVAFLDALIEDYADEWLTKAMFHYRWHYTPDAEKSGRILPLHQDVTLPADEAAHLAALFTQRQIGRLRYVGSNPITGPVIETSYQRFLDILEVILAHTPFLFGARPAASDFAIFGQLSALAQFDPTPAALALARAPRVYAWVGMMDDYSGLPDDTSWSDPATASVTLRPLLTEIGQVYAPLLLANEAAIASGAELVKTTIGGHPWEQAPFPYQLKCLKALRAQHSALGATDLARTECWMQGTALPALFSSDRGA